MDTGERELLSAFPFFPLSQCEMLQVKGGCEDGFFLSENNVVGYGCTNGMAVINFSAIDQLLLVNRRNCHVL